MLFLTLRAYRELLLCGRLLQGNNFAALYDRVRECGTSAKPSQSVEQVCRAMDIACILYPRHVLCLQRSAATTRLLRQCGVASRMVIGTQSVPFRAHAWVEVDGAVVNDKPYMQEIYEVLDHC